MKRFGKQCCVALLYYVVGSLSLLMTIPPGYASAFWPAAGLALGSAILLGPAYLAGVAAGSFALNFLNIGIFTDYPLPWMQSLTAALIIALGSVLQAFAGYSFLSRPSREYPRFDTADAIIRFFFVVLPACCLISSTVGILGLKLVGLINREQMLINWLTWWAGDVIGVGAGLPLILSFLAKPAELWRPRRKLLSIPVLLANGLFVVLYLKTGFWQAEDMRRNFEKRAALIINDVERQINEHSKVFHAIRAFWSSTQQVTRREFQTIASYFLKEFPAIQELGWAPLVHREDIDRFQRLYGFQFVQKRPLPLRTEDLHTIAPLTYKEPKEQGVLSLTSDLLQDPELEAALPYARRINEPISIPKSDPKGHRLLLSIMPIHHEPQRGEAPLMAEAIQSSFIIGIMALDRILDHALSHHDFSELQMRVYFRHEPNQPFMLFRSPTAGSTGQAPSGLQKVSIVPVFNQDFLLHLTLPTPRLLGLPGWETWFILGFGALFTLTLTAFLLIVTGQTLRVEAMVAQRTLELKEQRVRAEYASKMAALGLMAGGIAHEINNPLAIIHGYACYLLRRFQGQSEADSQLLKGLRTIEETCRRIADIIVALRSYARDDSADALVPIAPHDIIEETLQLCLEKFKRFGIAIDAQLNSHDAIIRGRKAALMQVLLNLLNNARDAIEALSDRWIRVELGGCAQFVEIRVIDSGAGINPTLQEKIMQPFYTTKPEGEGTGLGLSVSKGLTESMGGTLELEPCQPNTSFLLRFPRYHQ